MQVVIPSIQDLDQLNLPVLRHLRLAVQVHIHPLQSHQHQLVRQVFIPPRCTPLTLQVIPTTTIRTHKLWLEVMDMSLGEQC